LLVDLARDFPDVLGSAFNWRGFSGATVTLCEGRADENIAQKLGDAYAERPGEIHAYSSARFRAALDNGKSLCRIARV
jgi:galactokinase